MRDYDERAGGAEGPRSPRLDFLSQRNAEVTGGIPR